jgi:hypothetical protein
MTGTKAPLDDQKVSVRPVGRYRKVELRIWSDEKFRDLSRIPPCAQGLFLYLITGPHTGALPGLFRAGRMGMAEELGWEIEDFDKAFREVSDRGMVKADFKARFVWIPNAIRHNRPESPNVVRGWASGLDVLPECDLKREALESLKASVHALGEPFARAFDEALGKALSKPSTKAMPNQEQEQEQEQDPEQEQEQEQDASRAKARGSNARSASGPSANFEAFWNAWPRSDRKGGKAECVKVWEDKGLEIEASAIVAHVGAMAKTNSWTEQGGKFVPAPAVYLRQRRWDGAELPAPARDAAGSRVSTDPDRLARAKRLAFGDRFGAHGEVVDAETAVERAIEVRR